MINEAALLSPAYFIIPDVLPMKSESASTSCVHSGWVRTSASGYFFLHSASSAALMPLWIGQNPGLKMKFFSGIWLATYLPRFSSGIKRMFLLGSALTTFTAFAEVTHTSEWLFKSAVEFI